MKSLINKMLITSVATLFIGSSSLTAAEGTLQVDAEVAESLLVSNTTPLDFGKFALVDDGAIGTLLTDGADTNIEEIDAPTIGTVTITGAPGEAVTVSIDNPNLTDTGSNGGAAMTTSLRLSETNPTLTGGSVTLNVNGTLNVALGQTPSTYQGSATVTVNY